MENYNQLAINTKIDEDLNKEIERINLIYEEIIELNQSIKKSEFISLDDLQSIKKQSDDFNKLNNLNEQLSYLHKETCNRMISKLQQDNMNDLNREISKLHYINQHSSWKNLIHNLYPKINTLNSGKISYHEKNLYILALEIIQFNLQKKLRLKEIYQEYHSEDFVKELLAELYKKEIEIIKANLL
jgi:hypothetical protein